MRSLRRVSNRYYFRQVAACFLICCMFFNTSVLLATPTSSSAINASVGPEIGNLTSVAVGADKAIVNWTDLDTTIDQSLEFVRAGGNFAVLNKVTSIDGTQFNGKLFGNQGTIIIVDAKGLVFGSQSFIQARNFIGSSMNLDTTDMEFLNGSGPLSFSGGTGNVELLGRSGPGLGYPTIEAQNIALLGKQVINRGVIKSTNPGGFVIMASGDNILLAEDGSKVSVVMSAGNIANRVVDNGGSNGTGPGQIEAQGGNVILAAGDVFSTAISGVESLRAEAQRDVHLEGSITATGSVVARAGIPDAQSGIIHVKGDIEAGSIELKAGSNTGYDTSGSRVYVGYDPSTETGTSGSGTFSDVSLTSTDGGIDVEAVHDVFIGGDVTSAGDVAINADKEGIEGPGYGGDLIVKGSITAQGNGDLGGNVDLWGNGIEVADVSALDGTLVLMGRTSSDNPDGGVWRNAEVAANGTLLASEDVYIWDAAWQILGPDNKMTLTGSESLEIRAGVGSEVTGGDIYLINSMIGVTGSHLTLEQESTINMADDMWDIFNKANTHLTLVSSEGSVLATTAAGEKAADKWASIGAHAAENIELSGGKIKLGYGDVAGRSLWAENGFIDVAGFNVSNSSVNPTGSLEAGDYLNVDVVHGIDLGGNVTSGGDMLLRADKDKRWGQDVKVAGDISSGGTLTVEGTNVDIQGAHSDGYMSLYAHGLYDAGDAPEPLVGSGDVHVGGALTSGDTIEITATDFGPGSSTTAAAFDGPDVPYSAEGKIFLEDDVTADVDILLHNNTVAADGVTFDAGQDMIVDDGMELAGKGGFTALADRDIILGGAVSASSVVDGDILLDAGEDVWAKSTITNPGGSVSIYSSNTSTYLDDTVDVSGNIYLNNTTYAKADLLAGGNITTNGVLTLDGTDGFWLWGIWIPLDVDQTMDAGGDIFAYNNIFKTTKGDLLMSAGDFMQTQGVTVSKGALTASAGANMYLQGDIWSKGKMALTGNSDGIGSGSVIAFKALTTDGLFSDIVVSALNGGGIYLYGDVDAGRSLYLNNYTFTSSAGITLEARKDVRVKDGQLLDAAGDLLVDAGDNIILGGNVQGRLYSNQITLDAGDNVTVKGTINTTFVESGYDGNFDIYAGDDIDLWNAAQIEGDFVANAALDSSFSSSWSEGSINTQSITAKSITLETGFGRPGYSSSDITTGPLTSTGGDIYARAHHDLTVNGDVSSAADVYLNGDGHSGDYIGGDKHIYGGDVVVTGDIDAQGRVDVLANNISLQGVEAGSDVIITGNTSPDNAGGPVGDVYVYGLIDAGGDVEIYSSDTTTYLGDDVYAGGSVLLNNNTEMIGSGDQRVEAETGTLTANADVTKVTGGDLTMAGAADIYLRGDVKTTDGDLVFEDAVWADGVGDQVFDADGNGKKLIAQSSITKATDGDLTLDGGFLAGYEIELGGDVTVNNGNLYVGIGFDDTTVAAGKTLRSEYGDVEVSNRLNGEGDLDIWAADDVRLHGDTTVAGHFDAKAGQRSGRNSILYTKNITAGSMVLESGNRSVDGSNWDNIQVAYGKDLLTTDGDMTLRADDHITLGGDATSAGQMRILANHDSDNGGIIGDVEVKGDLVSGGDMKVMGRSVTLGRAFKKSSGNATANGELKIVARDFAENKYNTDAGDVTVYGELKTTEGSGGDIIVKATDDIILHGSYDEGYVSADSDRDIILKADLGNYSGGYGGDVEAHGDLLAGGDVTIDASDDTIHLWGDVVAGDDVWFKTNVEFEGWDDQFVEAGGMIRADGYLNKLNDGWKWRQHYWSDGSLYLIADGDIRLEDYVKAAYSCIEGCWSYGGGVGIFSGGSIYTGTVENGLNVPIIGRSDHFEGVGIYDIGTYGTQPPRGVTRAAIVIVSNDDLNLGSGASLSAYGRYYESGVDDRAGINFVDTAGTRIPSPDGPVRNPGDPFDLAIYVASNEGDVHVGGPVKIASREWFEPEPELGGGDLSLNYFEVMRKGYWECVPRGTMVVDALTNVTFGQPFIDSLEGGDVGDRLELVSRVTEWLYQAVGRLPFPDSFDLPEGYNYVLRGAGGFNEGAWVLENPIGPPPLYQEAGENIEPREFGQGGCPALMQWLAQEVGVPEEDIQAYVDNTFALSTDIQPCDSCARLQQAAKTLDEAGEAQMAALAQVVNEFVTPGAPPTPEAMTSIATAFANNVDNGTAYAMAGEYLDALVQYVGILNSEMGWSAGDAVALLNSNHAPASDNEAVNAYIQARLAAIGSGI